jgi:IS5 family transposase
MVNSPSELDHTPKEELTMRTKSTRQGYLDCVLPSTAKKVVKEYREKYQAIDRILIANPGVLDLAHADFCARLSESEEGRESRYTSEEIVRALVVLFLEEDSYRDVVVRIENSDFLRSFIGFGFYKPMMDFTFVSKAFAALSAETWESMNALLGQYACAEDKISGERMRVDATVYETNIHYPTDSSLLWDSFRVLARVLQAIQQAYPALGLAHRYHARKVKKLAQSISRNAGSASPSKQRMVKRWYRTLIDRVRWIVGISQNVRALAGPHVLETFALEHYVPLVARVIDQAKRRVFQGESVPADEKLYSLFEDHTELLKRGKAGKPVEFGHKILVAQTGEKFITHYQSLPHRKEDPELLPAALKTHRELFGAVPAVLATDKGFYASAKQLAELEDEIETVSICKKSRLSEDEKKREHTEAFQDGQRFRSGIEGSISVLKRAFNLKRCLFKGFKHFAASVGCAVFCHNLVLLTRL